MSSCQFVINAHTPQFIAIADKPLNLGGKIEYLAIEEFQKRFGIVYNDGISIDLKTRISPFQENITGDVSASDLRKQVEKVLKVGRADLVICNMGEWGYGVFASKEIPKNTVIAVYAGTIFQGGKVSNEKDFAFGYYGTNMSFSSKHHRGIASFMQHLPEEPRLPDAKTLSLALKMFGQEVSEEVLKLNVELYSTEFDSSKTRELIAIESTRHEYLEFNKIPVIAIVTNKDIEPGDQLGFNYGYQYWLSREITPEFFDKNGNVLSRNLYKRVFGKLKFDNFSYTGAYAPLIESLKTGRTSIMVIGDDKKSHEISVGKLLSLLLRVNACRLEINLPT